MFIETKQLQSGTRYKSRVRLCVPGFNRPKEASRTFNTHREAEVWGKRAKKLAETEGVKGLEKSKGIKNWLVGDVIKMVLNNDSTAINLGRSKKSNLRKLLSCPIAKIPLEELRPIHLFEHCRYRRDTHNVKPSTISHDISNLCTALSDGRTFFDTPCSKIEVFMEARSTLQRNGLISRSCARTRRATPEEYQKIETALQVQQPNVKSIIPLGKIARFAIHTCLRRSELVKARWGDIDWQNKTLTIRTRKHPRKELRHTDVIPLCPASIEIISSLLKGSDDDFIFPYQADSISSEWRKLMVELNIEDYRFHDLRSEGACQLYEQGLNIREISKITGHRSLNILDEFYLRIGLIKRSLLT